VIEPSALKGTKAAEVVVSNDADWGSTGAPVDKGYTKIYSKAANATELE
jgi:hypothetical protein